MKFLIGISLFLSSLFATPDSSGWVAVERPVKSSIDHAGDEDDPDIWVIFSKKMGADSFMVRFPEDPKYTYLPNGDLEMTASKEGNSYRLTVQEGSLESLEERAKAIAVQPEILLVEATRSSADTLDILYRQEDKWVWEHLFLTPHHLYIFQTKSLDLQGDGHRYFIQSFDV